MPSLQAPAKINLFLNLLGPRLDGFHEVCFVMQTIGLYDTVTLTFLPEQSCPSPLQWTCNLPNLTPHPGENLVVKAFYGFYQAAGLPAPAATIHLEKQIPVQAGLGGGSSDAAAMLKLLQEHSGVTLPTSTLHQLAAQLGSDVPFFLTGGTALATGRGEKIQALPTPLPSLPLVVVKPKAFGISTPLAFQQYREAGHYHLQAVEPFLERLPSIRCAEDLTPFLFNDFESVLLKEFPQLATIGQAMKDIGIERPILSGSGPSMVGFLPSKNTLNKEFFHQHFPTSAYDVFLTHTL